MARDLVTVARVTPPPSRETLDGLLRNHKGNLSLLERLTGYSRRHLRRLASVDYGLDLQSYRDPSTPASNSNSHG